MDNFQNYQPNRSAASQDVALRDAQSEKQRIAAGTEELKKELMENWKKNNAAVQIFPSAIARLSKELVIFLLSLETMNAHDASAKKYGCSEAQRTQLSHAVWKIAIQNDWEKSEQVLREKMGIEAMSFANFFQDVSVTILKKARELSLQRESAEQLRIQEEPKKKTVSLPLEKALQAYPKIEQQFIGSGVLRMKYSSGPLNPSIRNWITDYRDVLGAQKHGTLDRANYLFQSPNGRNLDATSRKKLAEVLQSLDEGSILEIDPENQNIIFNFSAILPGNGPREAGSLSNHSIVPAGGFSHNFAGQSDRSKQAIPSEAPSQSQSATSSEMSLTDDAGGARQGGWEPAKKMPDLQMGILGKFAPQGLANVNISSQARAEEKILEKSVGIGSDEYFQRKNEEYDKLYAQPARKSVEASELKNNPRMRFESPQNPQVWQNSQDPSQVAPQAYSDLSAQPQAQPSVPQPSKPEDIQGGIPRIQGNVVDLSQ